MLHDVVDTCRFDTCFVPGYIANEMPDKAVDLFNQIRSPDQVTTTLLFNACAEMKTADALILIKSVLSKTPESLYSNAYLMTSLLDALMKCGDVKQARSLFDTTARPVLPMYGAMMKGELLVCFRHGNESHHFRLHNEQASEPRYRTVRQHQKGRTAAAGYA